MMMKTYLKKHLPLLLLVLMSLPFLIAADVPEVQTPEVETPEAWTGDPDPFACNSFGDCFQTIQVCIANTSYTVGVYFDPASMTDEAIEQQALYWTGTVLTVGACSSQPATPLIYMYVYYSEVPFFGETNTMTLFSAMGIPSKERVTYWAGGTLPEGFDYQKGPACTDILYDNGTDQGYFPCDAFLASVHERRAWLRNDPEGPKFDLEPKLERYFKMLEELGQTPTNLP